MDVPDTPSDGLDLPARLRQFLRRVPCEELEKAYVILGDFAEVRQMLDLTLLMRTLVRRAQQAVIRGRLTSSEFAAAFRRIRRAMEFLRRDCQWLANAAGCPADLAGIRSRHYDVANGEALVPARTEGSR